MPEGSRCLTLPTPTPNARPPAAWPWPAASSTTAGPARWVAAQYDRLDVLVSNAGIGGFAESAAPSQTPLYALRAVYEANVFGMVALTNALLPLARLAR
ncbi:SDR family NAD(P)-dependent oxidoreductase [Lipingzhangella sp. LS1_29]|uniref:SDR family NAD(P)-dependent oxidoreductase n=1 Tax=Lipingzhangella rawalii TaxID=2055835 RepID=A0ABU2H2A8_9ACTN|nr:SDR family NAD(P)-dependent oxidoreductase [Lipingzhangella rawalii]MDS1269433.1 SDR family NAD(P)-dependent oxidoreductase [Lipingzhangella rawalii]